MVLGIDDEGDADDLALLAGDLETIGGPAPVGGRDDALMGADWPPVGVGLQQQRGIAHQPEQEPSRRGDGECNAGFWACVLQNLAQDFGLHGLAAEQTLQFADLGVELRDVVDGNDLLVRADRLVPRPSVSRVHWNSRLGETPWSRATAETVLPGCRVCSTT